jgi:hypothetical protein
VSITRGATLMRPAAGLEDGDGPQDYTDLLAQLGLAQEPMAAESLNLIC